MRNMAPKTLWLICASIFTLGMFITYVALHSTNCNSGEALVKLDSQQLSTVNAMIATGDSTEKTDSLVISYLNDILDVKETKAVRNLVEDYTDEQLITILPTYQFKVHSYFWLSGCSVLLEVFFWSIFGLLANLMYSVTKAEEFDPTAVPEHIGKLFYTPLLAIIIYLSLNGLVNSGSISFEGVGKNMVVISFILGFFTKRTIELLKKVRDLVLPVKEETPETPAPATETTDDKAQKLAELAITQNEKELKAKYPIIESLEVGVTLNNTIGVIAHVKSEAPADFPTSLPVKENDEEKTVELEASVIETGEAHSGLNYRLRNQMTPGEVGSLGAVLVSDELPRSKVLLTCSHVALGGSGADKEGEVKENINVFVLDKQRRKNVGKLIYARLTKNVDAALVRIDRDAKDFDNVIPSGGKLGDVKPLDEMSINDNVVFYSSRASKKIEGKIMLVESTQPVSLQYSDGIKTFEGLIALGSKQEGVRESISEKGDSGSVVFTEDFRPFAMIIGGDSKYTYAVPIEPILLETNTKIYTA